MNVISLSMKKIFLISFLFLGGILFSCLENEPAEKQIEQRTITYSKEALAFCKAQNMNTDFCVLIDMSIHSGKQRLFLYDFKTETVTDSALVSHGCGDNPWGEDASKTNPTFSNINGSHQSSIGKFKIGKRGYSNWGIHVNYKLHGLDTTNNNAYKRLIVLHSWEEVSDIAVYPNGTPEGWGCPALSNAFMKKLDKKLQATSFPVLMWIYE